MSFKEAVTHVFQNYATFSGRARRSEYWFFTLFNMIVATVIGILASVAGEKLSVIFTGISGLYSLGILIPSLAVCWRRLHDIGKSGALYFLVLIPLVGPIILLIWMCTDSEPGDNMYGPCPKATAWAGYGGGAPYGAGGYAQNKSAGDDYAYFSCPGCGVQLRVTSGQGTIQIHCPQCGTDFNARS